MEFVIAALKVFPSCAAHSIETTVKADGELTEPGFRVSFRREFPILFEGVEEYIEKQTVDLSL